jgi:hypothetical protein
MHEAFGGGPYPNDGDFIGKDLLIGVVLAEGQGSGIRREMDLFFVAVHVGAGFHAEKKAKAYQSAMRRACQAAARVLSKASNWIVIVVLLVADCLTAM